MHMPEGLNMPLREVCTRDVDIASSQTCMQRSPVHEMAVFEFTSHKKFNKKACVSSHLPNFLLHPPLAFSLAFLLFWFCIYQRSYLVQTTSLQLPRGTANTF